MARPIEQFGANPDRPTVIELDRCITVFQPQFDARHELWGVEALARMQPSGDRTDQTLLRPGDFLRDITLDTHAQHVIHTALHASRVPRDIPRVSLNVPPALLADPGFTRRLTNSFTLSDRQTAIIELLEHKELQHGEDDMDRFASGVRTLRAAGFLIAIDDFPDGESSSLLLALHEAKISPDVVKVTHNRDDDAIEELGYAISSARSIGVECIVVEGIESQEQSVDALRAGGTVFQGFHFGRPDHISLAA
ncbi:EAL domain-containing protein [Candidatus Microgenomates bacterium]|nr:EAL domain-containing protein [Candidatus Microgenomates bacterium]